MYRRVNRKSNVELAAQWDLLAPRRDAQIRSGADVSFHRVLVPEIFRYIGNKRYRRVLDVGCGTGVLTSMLKNVSENIDGIDISGKSIEMAKLSNTSDRMNFFNLSVEDFAEKISSKYDLIVSNMVLMDVMNLSGVVMAVEKLLRPGGLFVFSMTNPLFLASYYGYEKESRYDYSDEIFIEGPFVISEDYGKSDVAPLKSTHVHRPISMYINSLSDSNLNKINISEPMPSADVDMLYPKSWKNPRYMIGSCRAGPKVKFV